MTGTSHSMGQVELHSVKMVQYNTWGFTVSLWYSVIPDAAQC